MHSFLSKDGAVTQCAQISVAVGISTVTVEAIGGELLTFNLGFNSGMISSDKASWTAVQNPMHGIDKGVLGVQNTPSGPQLNYGISNDNLFMLSRSKSSKSKNNSGTSNDRSKSKSTSYAPSRSRLPSVSPTNTPFPTKNPTPYPLAPLSTAKPSKKGKKMIPKTPSKASRKTKVPVTSKPAFPTVFPTSSFHSTKSPFPTPNPTPFPTAPLPTAKPSRRGKKTAKPMKPHQVSVKTKKPVVTTSKPVTKPVQAICTDDIYANYYHCEGSMSPAIPCPKITTFLGSRLLPIINFPLNSRYQCGGAPSGLSNNVQLFANYTARLQFPTSGTWTLYGGADDAIKIYLDGKLILDNRVGFRGYGEQNVTIKVKPDDLTHDVLIEYYQRDGFCGLVVSWSGPDTPKAVIPCVAWLRNATTSPVAPPATRRRF